MEEAARFDGPEHAPSERPARILCLVGLALYVLAVFVASANPGPLAWGFHLPGFLPLPQRVLVLALMVGGLALLAADAFGRDGRRPRGATVGLTPPPVSPLTPAHTRWVLVAGLALYGLALWLLRTRTYFLGDGLLWLNIIKQGLRQEYCEPLAGTVWWLYGRALPALGVPPRPEFLGIFSVICGVAVAGLSIGILREAMPRQTGWGAPAALLLTLGSVQLYCGYFESYTPTSVAILAYLWLGLRQARAACPWILLALSLAVAITFHFAAIFLLPSYLYLTLRTQPKVGPTVLRGVLPLALTGAILLLIGTTPRQWLVAVRIAARAIGLDASPAPVAALYHAVSFAHARDLVNQIALVMPIPAILGSAALASRRSRAAFRSPGARFLFVAALAGLAFLAAIVLTVPAAQDWDLYSIFLIPAAVLAVVVGAPIFSDGAARHSALAISTLSLGTCLSFVLVNASEPAGLRRFQTILDSRAAAPTSSRAYPYSLLAMYYEDKGDDATALRYSRLMLQSEPMNPRYWLKVGTELYRLGRYDEAIPVLEEARRRGPRGADARHNLGMAYAKSGRAEEGVKELRAAVDLEGGNDPELYYDLGVGYALAGMPDSTREIWRRIRIRWPGYAPAARGLRQHFGGEAAP